MTWGNNQSGLLLKHSPTKSYSLQIHKLRSHIQDIYNLYVYHHIIRIQKFSHHHGEVDTMPEV